jgi:hypothetical protein
MKIEKVIVASNENIEYLSFWPLFKKVWKNMGFDPLLIYTSKEPTSICNDPDVRFFNTGKIDSGFVSRNIRMLYPALFPNDICLISDIDLIPLNKNYFEDRITNLNDNNFIVMRDNVNANNQMPICWNIAMGSIWGEIFKVKNEEEIKSLLNQWYQNMASDKTDLWYSDQLMLKYYIDEFKKIHPGRIYRLNDVDTKFRRLDRKNYTNTIRSIYRNDIFTDFHMPRPYSENKILINLVVNHFFSKNLDFFYKYLLLMYLLGLRILKAAKRMFFKHKR